MKRCCLFFVLIMILCTSQPAQFQTFFKYNFSTLKAETLKITHPNGDEELVVGSDTIITWEGVLPIDQVKIEYSTDNGVSWNIITNCANNLKYNWRNISNTPSTNCLARLSISEIEWQKTYGGDSADIAYSIQQTSDGGYIVAGLAASNNGDVSGNHGIYCDYWIIKLDFIGNIEWQKTYGGSNNKDIAYSIQITNDNGIIVAGESNSNDGDVSGNHGESDY